MEQDVVSYNALLEALEQGEAGGSLVKKEIDPLERCEGSCENEGVS